MKEFIGHARWLAGVLILVGVNSETEGAKQAVGRRNTLLNIIITYSTLNLYVEF